MVATNTRDLLLAATSPRVLSIGLPASVAAAQAKADLAFNNAATANNALAIIAADNYLSMGEKPAVIKEWLAIDNEVGGLVTQASSLGVSSATLTTRKTELANYLVGLNQWSVLTVDTIIVSADFKAAFNNYYTAKIDLLKAFAANAAARGDTAQAKADLAFNNAATAQIDATAANTALNAIFADNVMSRDEKTEVVRRVSEKASEYAALLNQALALSVSSTAYVSANAALNSYLDGLSPSHSDLTQNTTIVRVDANAAFNNYYTAKINLLNAIAAKTATMATGLSLGATGVLTGPAGAQGQMTSIATVDMGNGAFFGARDRNDAPSEYPVGSSKQFKISTAVGLIANTTYCTLETIKQFSDLSGGGIYQYAYQGQFTYRRFCSDPAAAATGWGAWVQDLDRNAYTGDLNASKDITLLTTGTGITVNGNTVTRVGSAWDAQAYTPQGYVGGASVSFEPLANGADWMAGLDTNPTQNSSYGDIDFAFYSSGNAIYFYESGNPLTTVNHGPLVTGDVLSITYDGSNVRYMKNRTVLRTVAAIITLPLSFDSSMISGTLRNIRLIPLTSNNFDAVGGPNKPANGATVGAPAGTQVGGTDAATVEANAANALANAATANAGLANKISTGSKPVVADPSAINVFPFAGTRNLGTRTVSPTGASPFTYLWSLDTLDSIWMNGASNTASMTFFGSGAYGEIHTATAYCTVTDINGLTSRATVAISVQYG